MTAPLLVAQIQGQGTVSADNLNTFIQNCTNIAQLRSFIGLPGMCVFIDGSVTPGDGGAGPFYWNTTSVGPDDNSSVIVPQPGVPGAWIRLAISQTSPVNVSTIASLRNFAGGASSPVIWIEGYNTPADGGEGMFVYIPSDTTSADNGGTIIIDASNHRYYRETGGLPYSVKWFGATGNGSTNDAPAIQSTINAAVGMVYFPAGNYVINSTLNITSGIGLIGEGISKSVLFPAASIVAIAVSVTSSIFMQWFSIDYSTPQTSGLYAITVTSSSGQSGGFCVFRSIEITSCANGIQWINSPFFIMDAVNIISCAGVNVQVSNPYDIDTGDSNITNCTFFNFGTSGGAGIQWLSSGGLRVENNKFAGFSIGVDFLYAGNSGSIAPNTAQLIVTGNSFDTMAVAALSISRSTSSDTFNSVIISNNVMPDCGVGVSIPTDASGQWINSVIITGNTFIGPASGSPVGFEVDSVFTFNILNNTLLSNISTTSGISIGSNASFGIIQSNNMSGTFFSAIFSSGTSIYITNNIGYNPVGVSTPTPGASPYTYTAGNSPQTVYLSASTSITGITQNGSAILPAASGAGVTVTVDLGPLEAVIISYTGTLTAHVMTH